MFQRAQLLVVTWFCLQGCCRLSTAWVAFSEVVIAVWVLDTALLAVSGVATAGVAAVVGSDVAVVTGGSWCLIKGQGLGWGAMGWPGSECHRFQGPGGCFEAWDEVIVVVINDVGAIDGGCAGVVKGDVAGNGGGRGLVLTALGVV